MYGGITFDNEIPLALGMGAPSFHEHLDNMGASFQRLGFVKVNQDTIIAFVGEGYALSTMRAFVNLLFNQKTPPLFSGVFLV